MATAEDLVVLKGRLDDMNDVLARELDLEPAELRAMDPRQALVELRERMDAYKLAPEDITAWQQLCVTSPDHVGCFRDRLERAMAEPPSLLTVVAVSALGAGAVAFAVSYFRK